MGVSISGREGFNIGGARFIDSVSVDEQDNRPQGLAFNNTGDKMFIAGNENDRVYEYSLSTNFDVSTASLTDNHFVRSEDFEPSGVAFSDSGDEMFVTGTENNKVYQYFLGENFVVDSAIFSDSFDVSSQDVRPEEVTFSNSGEKMFVVDGFNDNVVEYSLSTSFEVTTASFTDSFDISSEVGDPTGIAFSDTGDKMFVIGGNLNVTEYSLSTNFDVSTASFTDSFDVSGQDIAFDDVAFSQTGDKMFVVGPDDVYEYSSRTVAAEISEAVTLSATFSASLANETESLYSQTKNGQVDFSLERSYFEGDSAVLNFDLQKGVLKAVNVSQFLSALDDVSAAFEVANVISESLTADASISKTPRLTQDVSASFDDSASVLSSKLVPIFVSPSDSFTKSAAKSLNRALNLSDFKRLSAAQNISESFGTDETASVKNDAVRFFDEGVNLTADTPSLFYGDFVEESLTAASFVATSQDAERLLTQRITAGDSDIRGINQKIGEFIDAEPFVRRSTGRSLSESLAAGDFSEFESLVSLSQAAGVNDDASQFLRSSLPQSISLADTESRVFAGSRSLQQGLDLIVSIIAFSSTFLNLTQSVSFLDSESVTRDFSRTIFQEERVGAEAQKLLSRGVSESAAASDVKAVLFRDLLSESQVFSDSEVMSVSLDREQDLSVEDDFLSSSVLLRAFNQDFQVVASQSSLASQRLLESVPLVDTVFDAFSFEKFRSASEKVAVSSDSVVSLGRVLSEDSAVADAVRFDSELLRRFEPVVSFDSFLKASQALSLAEVQRVSDVVRKSFSSGLSEAAAVSDAFTAKLPSGVVPVVADLSALRVAVAELSKTRRAFADLEAKA